MILRIKKSGDLIKIRVIINNKEYHSLDELNEDFEDLEDYKPAEPQIADEMDKQEKE